MGIEHTYGTVDRDYGLRLATTDPTDDGPVWMVNLMKYRERAAYADGDDQGDAITGREADDRYAPLDVLEAIGAEVVFHGDVDQQLLGDGTVWDRVGIVRYPTRRSFIDMQARDDFRDRHVHKAAGMDRTIVLGCLPNEVPAMPAGLDDVPWSDVPHPPTPDDGPVTVFHIVRFHDPDAARETPEHMVRYQTKAAESAGRHGVRVSAWFGVEGTILGDGRVWHQVRANTFPSKAAFMAVVFDPERLEAQRAHREVAIADTYTMIVRSGGRFDHDALARSVGRA
jgi:hypothetical protein